MKRMQKLLSLLFAAMLVLALPAAALAAENPTVDYTGQEKQFVFSNTGAGSATDLFVNFKGVMPGDTLSQTISVKNSSAGKVRIYLRMEPVKPEHKDFLDQLQLKVTNSFGSTKLYEAPPSEQDGLAENVLLGLFYPGAAITLTADLIVPLTLGNEYMEKTGDVVWVFTVEEVPEPTPEPTPVPTPKPPDKTGDETNLTPWLLLGATMLLVIAVLIVLKKRAAGNE